MKNAVLVVAVLGMALCATACKDDDKASCASAMENYYANECSLGYDDGYGGTVLITEDEAVDQCEAGKDQTAEYNCQSEMQDLIDCFDGATSCGECDSKLAAIYSCDNT